MIHRSMLLGSVAACLVAAQAPVALAQTTDPSAAPVPAAADKSVPASDSGLATTNANDIVITARKRTESLQNVPISVAVIGGARLQEQNLGNIEALGSITSGLIIRKTPNNLVNLTLRGLGTGTAIDAFEQPVATFIDGTYAGRGPEFNAGLFDIERVEVIRGAQASLLSKNTSLGAISLTTRMPGKVFSADAVATYDFALGSHSVETGIDVPLGDTLSVRVAGKYDMQGGWVHNRLTDDDLGRTLSYGARVTALWTPTDRLRASLVYQRFQYVQRGLPIEYFSDPNGQVASLAALAGDATFETIVDRRTSVGDAAFGQSRDHTHGNRIIATIDYDLGGDYSLTSVSSYSDFKQRRFRDNDFIAGSYVPSFYGQSNSQLQQELRLTSPQNGQFLDYVVGAAYFREIWNYDDNVFARCPGCDSTQLARFPLRGRFITTDRQPTTNLAAFAQPNLHLTDTLTLSGGVRYTHETRSATLARVAPVNGALPIVVFQPFSPVTLRRRENNVDYSAGVNWKPVSELLLYASASKGTKSGGFNNSTTNASGTTGQTATEYGNETARTYEIGEKFSLPNGGYFNVNLFLTNVDNFQNAIFVNPRFVITSRDLQSKGVEVEAAYQLVPGVRLQGQVTYADTRRRDGTDLRPAGAPKWSGNVNLAVREPVGRALTFQGDFGAEFRSLLFLTDENLTIGYNGSTTNQVPASPKNTLLNIRLGLKHDSGWDLALVGRNLTNKLVLNYGIPTVLISSTGALVTPNQPRTVAVQVGYHF